MRTADKYAPRLGGSNLSACAEPYYPKLNLRDHPAADRKAGHLEFEHRHVFLYGWQQRWASAAKRDPTQFRETILPKTLCIEIAITGHKDPPSLKRGHADHWIGRIVWNMVAQEKHTVATPPQIAADGIRYVLIKEKTELWTASDH